MSDEMPNYSIIFNRILEEMKKSNANFDRFFRVIETRLMVENFVKEEPVEYKEKVITAPGMAKLPKDLNKGVLDFNKVHKIGSKPCSKCSGPITWEYRPGIAWPIHVDEMGKIIGNGTCPEYKGDF